MWVVSSHAYSGVGPSAACPVTGKRPVELKPLSASLTKYIPQLPDDMRTAGQLLGFLSFQRIQNCFLFLLTCFTAPFSAWRRQHNQIIYYFKIK